PCRLMRGTRSPPSGSEVSTRVESILITIGPPNRSVPGLAVVRLPRNPTPRTHDPGLGRLQAQQVSDHVLLLWFGQLELQHDVEEFDRVVERRASAIVEVGRGILDPAEAEGLDRPLGTPLVEPLDLEVVHVVIGEL